MLLFENNAGLMLPYQANGNKQMVNSKSKSFRITYTHFLLEVESKKYSWRQVE